MKIIQICAVGAKALQAKTFSRKRIPLSVYLSVTDRCPHACEYCNIPNRRLKEMPGEQLFRLIRQIRKAGAERVQIVGGEPLIREDIAEIVNYAKQSGLYVTASSTGSFPQKVTAIKNIDLMFLSFDGEEKVHDFHKGEGTYRKLMESIGRLKELRVNFLTVTTITKQNKDSIDFILKTARDNSFMTVFQPLYYTGSAYKNHFHLPGVDKKYILNNEEMRNIIKKLIGAKLKGAPIASSLSYLKLLSAWEDYSKIYSPQMNKRISCWAGRLYCYIDTDGLVYPCGDSIGIVKGVDCLQNGFEKGFDGINMNSNCRSCIIACDLEKNLMFSLNIGTIMNWMNPCLH